MANRYALQSFWFHNSVSGKEEFVGIGALRDSVTSEACVLYPALFTATALTTATGLDPKTAAYLALHAGGPGDGIP